MKRPPKDTENMRIAAAMTSMGATQKEIAKWLGLSQPTVSNLIKDAVLLKWLGPRVWLKSEDDLQLYGTPKALESLDQVLKKLAAAEMEVTGDYVNYWPGYQGTPPEIHSFHSRLRYNPTATEEPSHDPTATKEWSEALPQWAGCGVAKAFKAVLESSPGDGENTAPIRVGIGWGRQIRAVHQAMGALPPKEWVRRLARVFEFIPLMGARNQMVCEDGDETYTNPYSLSANELAFDFDRLFNAKTPANKALSRYIPGVNFIPFEAALTTETGGRARPKKGKASAKKTGAKTRHAGEQIVPRLFPFRDELSDDEMEAERTYLQDLRRILFGEFPAYVETFGLRVEPPDEKDTSLCANLDGIVAAVGDKNAPLMFGREGTYAGVLREWFQANVVGDIASVPLLRGEPPLRANPERRTTDSHIHQQYRRFQRRWMGVTEKHIRACADRKRAGRGIGVLVLAFGASRAEVVLECFRRGLVNHLFADYSLLEALQQLAEEKLAEPEK